jgi:hypothetical protein
MTIKATCGHTLTKVEGLGVTCSTKGYTREGERTVRFGSYCFACYKKFVCNNEVLLTEEAEEEWMESESWDGREDLTLDLPNSTIYELMKQAHELDITFNQLVENILREELNRIENDNSNT